MSTAVRQWVRGMDLQEVVVPNPRPSSRGVKRLSLAHHQVLLELAWRAWDNGRTPPITFAEVGGRCHISARQVRRHLRDLVAADVIRAARTGPGRGHANVYWVRVPWLASTPESPLDLPERWTAPERIDVRRWRLQILPGSRTPVTEKQVTGDPFSAEKQDTGDPFSAEKQDTGDPFLNSPGTGTGVSYTGVTGLSPDGARARARKSETDPPSRITQPRTTQVALPAFAAVGLGPPARAAPGRRERLTFDLPDDEAAMLASLSRSTG